MPILQSETLTTPRRDDLGLRQIVNTAGFSISLLPSGAVFAIEHTRANHRIMINQILASPIGEGMGRLFLRTGGDGPIVLPIVGPASRSLVGAADDRFVWKGEQKRVRYRVSLWLHPRLNVCLWRIEVANKRNKELPCDTVLVQDLGLGDQGFLMNNEAYASQYLDHHIARHSRLGYVIMTRQNLSQGGAFPWIAHGCLEGAAGYATDFRQFMGAAYRDAELLDLPFGTNLPSSRLQYETASAALQSKPAVLPPGGEASWTFFGFYQPDHPAASSDADLKLIDRVRRAAKDWAPRKIPLSIPVRSVLHDAPPAVAGAFEAREIAERYPRREHFERVNGQVLSLFVPGRTHSRHVVMRDKERMVARRHGALLFNAAEMLPSDATLCATCWMHGVFGAQLTIGNTAFHKLFSVSRDPYNITRASGLRILVGVKDGWRLLTVPSGFVMGFNDCRWIYRLGAQTITVSAVVSGEEPAIQWRLAVEGGRRRFLIFGDLVLGEAEFGQAGRIEIDRTRKRFAFRPDPSDKWGQKYPNAVYWLVPSASGAVDAIGGDELLYLDGKRRGGPYAAIKTRATSEFAFAVVGSLTDPARAAALADKYARPLDEATMLASSDRFWRKVTRGVRLKSAAANAEAKTVGTIVPWLAHDAMAHLTVARGLEQYAGAAWGTRDVCQGPMEMLLSLEHDEPARQILRVIFAQQYQNEGDWPQWFMLEPYAAIQGREAHGDIIVWPLKALCDYVEATGDFAFLDEPVAWRREDNFEKTTGVDPVAVHIDKLIATARERFVAGTHLMRYGNGDWNDSLQPVDPAKHDWMVSSWTVALFYQQLRRYAEILRRAGRLGPAKEREALAAEIRKDFNRYLIRDGVTAGYGVFSPAGGPPELLLHPRDRETGLSYSLIPMTQAIAADLFTPAQARRHLGVIRKYLLFPDGARLMDRPIAYHGGPETIFRRAESAAFFGREIGLMYVHSHLRYAEAMSALGESQAMWDALLTGNPIAVTDRLTNASLRQRNAYFSSSDAAYPDRYRASAAWGRVKAGAIAVDGGWRIYSSGPGVYVNLAIQHALGVRRWFGKRIVKSCLPSSQKGLSLSWPGRAGAKSPARR